MATDIVMKGTNQIVRYTHDEFINHNEVELEDNFMEESTEKEVTSSQLNAGYQLEGKLDESVD